MNKKRNTLFGLSLLALTASAQQISATQSVIDCGQTRYLTPVTAEFKLKNEGSTPLHINDIRKSCGCTSVVYPQKAIAPGDSFAIQATYDAKQMGSYYKQIGLYTSATATPFTLAMQGRVVNEVVDFAGSYPYTLGQLKADAQEVEFDDVNKGDRPVQRIHIQNPTEQTLEPQVMHLPAYLGANVSPSRLAPHRSGTITIWLDSRKLSQMGLNQTNVYLGDMPGDRVSADKMITVSAVLLPDFDKLSDRQKAQAPKIKLSTDTLNLGSFGSKKKLKGVVEITNEGKTELDISNMQMFTSGLQVSLPDSKIEPGKTVKLKITAVAADIRKSRVAKPRILIITNDPTRPKVTIYVKTK